MGPSDSLGLWSWCDQSVATGPHHSLSLWLRFPICKTVEVKLDSAAACSPRCHESELRASHTVSHRIVCGVDPLVVPTAQTSKSRPSEDE